MLRILGLKIFSPSRRPIAVSTSFFNDLGFHRDALFRFKFFSVLADERSSDDSSLVSYLTNSCGMPSETALNVASKVNFRTPSKPDSVLSLLRSQGLTETQISKVVKGHPRLLFSNSDRTLLPKFEFLHSIGLSRSECAVVVCSCPPILRSSLKNHLIPCYNYLKSVLVEDEKVLRCLKVSPRAFLRDLQENIAPNIAILRNSGVYEVAISYFVSSCPDSAFLNHSKFCNIVNRVRDLGFNPSKIEFVLAIKVLSKMTSFTWERKLEAYRKCGWSKDHALLAFKKFPQCFSLSEEKIFKIMDFFVQKMGLKPEDIATTPKVMVYSLEKRIIPRCSVVQSLYSKGLLKKQRSISSIVQPSEKTFLERYVNKFPEDVAWLLHLYNNGELKVSDA